MFDNLKDLFVFGYDDQSALTMYDAHFVSFHFIIHLAVNINTITAFCTKQKRQQKQQTIKATKMDGTIRTFQSYCFVSAYNCQVNRMIYMKWIETIRNRAKHIAFKMTRTPAVAEMKRIRKKTKSTRFPINRNK